MKSIRVKILLSIFLTAFFITGAVSLIFYFRSARTLEENYGKNLYERVQVLGDEFDERLKEIYIAAVRASCDGELKKEITGYYSDREQGHLENISDLLIEYKKKNSDITSVYAFLEEGQLIVATDAYSVYWRESRDKEILEQISPYESSAIPALVSDPYSDSRKLLSFTEEIADENGKVIGYLMIGMRERNIYYRYLDQLDGDASIDAMILNHQDMIVSSGKTKEIETEHIFQTGREIENQRKNSYIKIRYRADFTGYQLVAAVEKEEILKNLSTLKYFFAFFLVLFLAVTAVLSYIISRKMVRPLKNLMFTIGEVKEGNLETRVEIQSKDEISMLSEHFNEMLEQIEELIEQLVQEKLLKRDAELEALQYQITPHFMYNTLNSIKYGAILKGEQELGGLLGDFIELLQASIQRKGAFVSVMDEIRLLKNYINLQQFRYGNTFEAVYKVAEETENIQVPRLLLQPIVENAILHGMDIKSGKSKVFIETFLEHEDILCLRVSDNGRGMTDEQIGKLLDQKKEENSGFSGIGVSNIKERLHLCYGEKGVIQFKSSEKGTTVEIRLPTGEF